MKVICTSRRRSDVVEPECRAYASEISYELQVGREYTVYGQYVARGCLLYLIDPYAPDDPSRPIWYPASLFSVKDARMPCSWRFAYYPHQGFSGRVTAVWGYEELATSSAHFGGLLEREDEAMLMFIRRKIDLDHESNAEGENEA